MWQSELPWQVVDVAIMSHVFTFSISCDDTTDDDDTYAFV